MAGEPKYQKRVIGDATLYCGDSRELLRAGVFVGSVQKGRFVPEHHLFTAFGGLCTNCEQLTLADCRCTEYLSGCEVEARTAADGWCCVTVDGWPLGGGKVSGGRVKNHYPKALRLL